jgi:hypothetical protein
MTDRGMLFTLSMATLGLLLLAFSVDYNLISKETRLPRLMMGLERASSQSANVAFNLQRVFRESSGLVISQSGDTLFVNMSMPTNLSLYQRRVMWLKNLTVCNLANVSVSLPLNPTVRSPLGFNVTQLSDRTIVIQLPVETKSITLTSYVAYNISNCTLVAPPSGNVQFTANVDGNPNSCHRSRALNLSDSNLYDVSTGGVTVTLERWQMTVTDNIAAVPFSFGLELVRNESVYTLPMTLDGEVKTILPDAMKVTEIELQ